MICVDESIDYLDFDVPDPPLPPIDDSDDGEWLPERPEGQGWRTPFICGLVALICGIGATAMVGYLHAQHMV